MSGLETAIRNALDRSDRADGQTRAKIYQSARQALEAGLRRQGVTDTLIIMQQQKRLEEKIREIEAEEIDKLAAPSAEQDRPADLVEVEPEPVHSPRQADMHDEILLEGETRRLDGHADVEPDTRIAPVSVEAPQAMVDAPLPQPELGVQASSPKGRRRRARSGKPDMAAGPGAKPRRRRGFLSRLATWMITLAVVGIACWWFYQSGMVQSVLQEAIQAADRAAQGSGRSNAAFDPRGGFSDEWTEIFKPADVAALQLGSQAKAEAVDGSEGRAVRLVSAAPGEDGDIVIQVPAEVLREMAAKSSTIALTVQSGMNQAAQMSVRCDFGSLGNCSRHRFTATQERLEALFKVTFERTIAPNSPGRLVINAGIDGPDKPVLLYSVRILPGR
ncbi:hypothetical protein E2F50_13530 [Rhizobium deserti]|uniref:Biotin transporter BioY n=1 Tax=Rhizobium deserti TaxID=2547961 RepID=A0A4R5UH44_9HYPH|nr:hypothetical protein [Rhizobium deserti]TDK35271.1 hypothetical protein E2F50_13530 [Rhizobium deserti]